jgi:16S rRNA (adenine(1408)-N(1))-methyltransferase
VIGIDPVAAAMADASRRAAAKPARGGLGNILFLQASLENLGGALDGLADLVTVNYPWGSLLRAVALPDTTLLKRLATLAKQGAAFEIRVNLQPLRDAQNAARLGLVQAALLAAPERLKALYAAAGLSLTDIDNVTGAAPPVTRWGKQLHFAGREIRRLRAVRTA